MDMTRDHISFTFDSRALLNLSLHIAFSFVRAAVAFSVLEEPLVLSQWLLFSGLDLPLNAIGAVGHKFGLLNTFLHFRLCAGFVLNTALELSMS